MNNRTLQHLIAAVALALFVALLYYPLLFTNRVLASGDILLYFYPYRDYAAEAFRQGRIPLWNPYLFMGVPFLANPQAAVLYPLHWPLSWLPVTQQIYWSIALHTWLLGFGGYLLMRQWSLRLTAGLATGLVLAGSGFFGGLVGHLNQLNGAAWLPWGFWILDFGFWVAPLSPSPLKTQITKGDKRFLAIAGFALIVALMLLAGHTQTAYINLFGLGVWCALQSAWRLLSIRSQGSIQNPKSKIQNILVPLLIYFAGALLGVLLAAAQLLPSLELNGLGLRQAGLDYFDATSFSLKLWELHWSLLPSYGLKDLGMIFGAAYTEFVAYVGVVGLILAGFAIGQIRNTKYEIRGLLFFGFFFALLGLFLALGRANPLYYYLYKLIPGFNLFRVPGRWMMLYTMGMAVLAGVAMERGARGGGRGARGESTLWVRVFLAPRSSLLATLLLFLLALDLLLAARSLPHTQTTAPQAVYDRRTAPAFLLSDSARSLTHPAATGRFLGMSTITYDPGDMGDFKRMMQDQLDEKAFEQLIIGLKVQELLVPNLSLLWRIPSVDGYDGGVLPLQRYNKLAALLIPPEQLVPDGRLREQVKEMPSTRLLNLLHVKYVITDKVRDLWFEDIFYDRQIGGRLTQAEELTITAPRPFEATHLDLIGYIDADESVLQSLQGATVPIAEVQIEGEGGQRLHPPFTLLAGDQPAAQLADGALDSQIAQRSGATVAYRDVEGKRQEYRLRLRFNPPNTPLRIVVRHLSAAPPLVLQAATLYDQRTKMFLPLLPSGRGNFRLAHSGDVKVYENQDLLPRAYLVHQTQVVQNQDEALLALQQALQQSAFDPKAVAVVEDRMVEGGKPFASQTGAIESERDQIEIVRYTAEQIEMTTQSSTPAQLVLSDAYYPGWQATIDGVSTPIYATNLLFRSVSVPVGNHTVIFRFDPESWRRGRWLSGVGAILWCVLLILGKTRPSRV